VSNARREALSLVVRGARRAGGAAWVLAAHRRARQWFAAAAALPPPPPATAAPARRAGAGCSQHAPSGASAAPTASRLSLQRPRGPHRVPADIACAASPGGPRLKVYVLGWECSWGGRAGRGLGSSRVRQGGSCTAVLADGGAQSRVGPWGGDFPVTRFLAKKFSPP
jgi:hypothetical protein